mmetsp:Transcript_35325/g.34356  ORF Transcript_35325/g.34356 Transcript_35325/m.34356 type:complete len:316 (-) Transcript_35325:267-1214(-)
MQRPLCFVKNELVGGSEQDRNGLGLLLAPSDLHDLPVSASGDLLDQLREAQLLLGEVVNVGHRDRTDGLRNEIYLVSVNVFDDHDVLLGEEVEGEFVHSVPQDGLLDQQHIAPSFHNLFDEFYYVVPFFFEDSVHGVVVMDDDVVLQVGLGGAQAELDQSNFSVLDPAGAASEVGDLLVDEDEAVNEFGVIDGPAQLLGDIDVPQIHILSGDCFIIDVEDGIHSHGGEEVGVGGDHLAGEGGDRVLDQLVPICQVHRLPHGVDDLHGLAQGHLEPIRDRARVDPLLHQILARLQERSCYDHYRCRPIPSFDILRL